MSSVTRLLEQLFQHLLLLGDKFGDLIRGHPVLAVELDKLGRVDDPVGGAGVGDKDRQRVPLDELLGLLFAVDALGEGGRQRHPMGETGLER